MSRMTFVNLPVKDLEQTTDFFTKLGFDFNETFSNDEVRCMVISDATFAMLHVEPSFKGFAGRDVADTAASAEVIVGLSATSQAEVDERAAKAVAAGGQDLGGGGDGFMYMRGFRDLDGHQWSFIYMDMSAMPPQ